MEPKDRAEHSWEKDGIKYYICYVDILTGHYCGYCEFPERPLQSAGWDRVVEDIPIHGGITYVEEFEGRMIYGFDCAHYGDAENPMTKNIEWLKQECERMATEIKLAAFQCDTLPK